MKTEHLLPQGRSNGGSALLLRSLFVVASVGLHGLAFASLLPRVNDQEAPIEGLELSLAPPQGEALAEEKDAVDSAAQTETVAAVQKIETPPPPEAPDLAEAAKVVDEEAPVMAAAVKEPEPQPVLEVVETPPEPVQEQPQVSASAQQTAAAEETFAKRAVGVENGLRTGGGVTRAAYAAAVKKEIAKNKRRPPGDWRGAVSLSFVIGPNGRAERIEVAKSVNPALDEAARSIIASVQLPPPPGGTFPAAITIKFE
jgi:TonB family protein